MAAITRLGPAGITMRRTTFVGVPAAPRDPFPVALSRGGFFSDVLPVIQHVSPIRILLLDELRVITRDEIIRPPQDFVEQVVVQLEFPEMIFPGEIFEDVADRRKAKRMSLRWFGIHAPGDDSDPFDAFDFKR